MAPSRTLEKYKKKLLVQVVAVFSICLVVILERIFYEVIVDSEQKSLSNLQLISDLADRSSGDVKVGQIDNGFLQFYATLSSFRIQFLLLTHIFATAFVSYDAIIATKVIYVSMAGIYCVSLFQMFYAGARPFWSTSDVLSASCLQ